MTTSGQCNLSKKAAHGRFNRIRQVAPMCTSHPIRDDSFDPPESRSQTASRSVQPFLHNSRQKVPILYNGQPLLPQNCPFARGIWTPIQYMVLSAHPSPQPEQHLDQFSGFCCAQLTIVTYRERERERDDTRSVRVGRVYICRTVMRQACLDPQKCSVIRAYNFVASKSTTVYKMMVTMQRTCTTPN